METKLENILDNMMQHDNVTGALLSDHQGLCYGSEFLGQQLISSEQISYQNMSILIPARGKVSPGASGLITAIADQAAKIHPNSNAPVVILESAER